MAKDLKEQIEIMTHYLNGGDVEYSDNNFETVIGESNKEDVVNLCWNWDSFYYRIKEQKQKVTIGKWLLKDIDSGEYFIMESSDVNLTLKDFPKWRKVKLIETYEVEL